MLADFSESQPRDQRVGNFSKGVQDGLSISQFCFIPRGFSLAILPHQTATLKQRTGSLGTDAPSIRAAQSKRGQFRADLSQQGGQADLREKLSDRLANLGVSG